MKKITKLIFCLLFSICCIFTITMNVAATKEENIYEGYAEQLDNGEQAFYIQQISASQPAFPVYCFANEKLAPPILNQGEELPTYHQQSMSDDKGCMALLYAGYPMNKTSLMQKYGVSEKQARKETQAALWTLQNADLTLYRQYQEPFASYYLALLNYAANNVNTIYDGYQIGFYESSNSNYQSMIHLHESDKNTDNKKPSEPDKDNNCNCVNKQDHKVSTSQFWLFIGIAGLFMVLIVIGSFINNRKCK